MTGEFVAQLSNGNKVVLANWEHYAPTEHGQKLREKDWNESNSRQQLGFYDATTEYMRNAWAFRNMDTVYAKVGGGLRMKDPGLDLGIVVAILSSLYDRPLPEGAVFWGEVDLNGQIRPVSGHDVRLRQAANLGYGPVVHPKTGAGKNPPGWSRLGDVQRFLFGQPGGKG